MPAIASRILKLITVIFLMTFANTLIARTKVEGLLYLTKKPVSVEIEDGMIVRIREVKRLSFASTTRETHPKKQAYCVRKEFLLGVNCKVFLPTRGCSYRMVGI